MELRIDGTVVETWTVGAGGGSFWRTSPQYQTFTYTHAGGLTDIEVGFTNGGQHNGTWRHIRLDAIEVNGVVHETEDATRTSVCSISSNPEILGGCATTAEF